MFSCAFMCLCAYMHSSADTIGCVHCVRMEHVGGGRREGRGEVSRHAVLRTNTAPVKARASGGQLLG